MVAAQDVLQKSRLATALWFSRSATGYGGRVDEEPSRKPDRRVTGSAFAGILAFGLMQMNGLANLGGWRWIFILEGLLTVVVGVAAKWWIPDWPETASFLTDQERSRLVARLNDDAGDARMDHLNKGAWRRILSDWKIYLGTLMAVEQRDAEFLGEYLEPTLARRLQDECERVRAAGYEVR